MIHIFIFLDMQFKFEISWLRLNNHLILALKKFTTKIHFKISELKFQFIHTLKLTFQTNI